MMLTSKQKSLYQFSFYWVALVLCGLPLFATIFCVTWSVLFNLEDSTRTHCGVRNYLPSVSAAIGGFSPQKYVWRICIGLHSTPRLLQAVAYYNYYTSVHVGTRNQLYMFLAAVNSLAHIIEVGALVGLTYVSSVENHGIHELCFILFMAGSVVYMSLTIILFSWGKQGSMKAGLQDLKSLRWKKRCCALNFTAFLLSMYLYYRHNRYCEPGVYSYFACCEYIVIATNIFFHGSALQDFAPFSLSLALSSLLKPTRAMQ